VRHDQLLALEFTFHSFSGHTFENRLARAAQRRHLSKPCIPDPRCRATSSRLAKKPGAGNVSERNRGPGPNPVDPPWLQTIYHQ
jgi:hypothetical protein